MTYYGRSRYRGQHNIPPATHKTMGVTTLIDKIQHPVGGFISSDMIEHFSFDDGVVCDAMCESVHPSVMGTAVEKMFEFTQTGNSRKVFRNGYMGALKSAMSCSAYDWRNNITDIGSESVKNAIYLAHYESVGAGHVSQLASPNMVNANAVSNLQRMVERTTLFFSREQPIVDFGYLTKSFVHSLVLQGEIDILTTDTIWDMKTYSRNFTRDNILQILIYWRLMCYDVHKNRGSDIKYIGLFNPRQNIALRICVQNIPADVVTLIDDAIVSGVIAKAS